ncbi:type II secretion system protein E [Candidatus Saccharibacteria bacterium QS_5_54_17]|nr:MAG: type II secretion system protein E [Candidatus Saccharibacteria bacterium QS_5_54_17]
MLVGESQNTFERLLVEEGYLSEEQLKSLRQESAEQNKSIINLISDRGLIDKEDIVKTVAKAENVPYADLHGFKADEETLNFIPKDLAKNYQVVPIGMMNGQLAVGMVDPTNLQAVDFITRRIGQAITPHMVSSESVEVVLGQYGADVSEEVSSVVGSAEQFVQSEEQQQKQQQQEGGDVQNLVQDAPITRALNTILDYAARLEASDIHIEPRPENVKIRFRIDGILKEIMTLPKGVEAALVSRVKILSSLKIDEHRQPQDGEFQMQHEGRDIDLRIAIAPIVWGEQVVIRLLDKDSSLLDIDSLGYKGRARRLIHEGLQKPYGMTLSTGPTGSGKSTTLYAGINTIHDPAINIITLEDPVEYKMSGINQIQINSQIGLTFASGLRSVLRQDPDVVMVGEIRDGETADLAVQAALTGHIVLSTLHTNSAAGVLPRLIDMGIEPFLVSSVINTVIGQRLVRRICDKCARERESTEAENHSIQEVLGSILPESGEASQELKEDIGYEVLPGLDQNAYTLYQGSGCKDCNGEGYKGRTGIFEVFSITDEMEKILVSGMTSGQVQEQAQKDGMITMRQDGYLKALNGVTTLDEVARVASDA